MFMRLEMAVSRFTKVKKRGEFYMILRLEMAVTRFTKVEKRGDF